MMMDSRAWMKKLTLPGSDTGPLRGLTFAVKDMYSIEGHTTSFGSPAWLAANGPASVTAESVRNLLDAGAEMVGVTQMDELAYSLDGENIHYGTPLNVKTPDRVPGGSSSGSGVRKRVLTRRE